MNARWKAFQKHLKMIQNVLIFGALKLFLARYLVPIDPIILILFNPMLTVDTRKIFVSNILFTSN